MSATMILSLLRSDSNSAMARPWKTMTSDSRSSFFIARSSPGRTCAIANGADRSSAPARVTRVTRLSLASASAMFQARIAGPAILAPSGSPVMMSTRLTWGGWVTAKALTRLS